MVRTFERPVLPDVLVFDPSFIRMQKVGIKRT